LEAHVSDVFAVYSGKLSRGGRLCGCNAAPVSMRRSARADFYMSLFNVVFTMLAPLVIGTIDQDVNRATSLSHPGASASNDVIAVDRALQNRIIVSDYAPR